MIYNVVLVLGVQQSDSVIHIHISCLMAFELGISSSWFKDNLQPCNSNWAIGCADLGLASLCNHMSQFFKINVSKYVYIYVYTHIHTYIHIYIICIHIIHYMCTHTLYVNTHSIGSVSLENPD